jgi:hypothetical protein
MRRFTTHLALAVIITACSASSAPGSVEPPSASAEQPSSRCEPASAALVSAIEAGLTVTGGGSLSNAFIVRSGDFENVYFVAAQIEGEGMGGAVGVWATNGPNGDGSIFSADAFAAEFSDWGDGPGFNLSDDGLAEARDCAEG